METTEEQTIFDQIVANFAESAEEQVRCYIHEDRVAVARHDHGDCIQPICIGCFEKLQTVIEQYHEIPQEMREKSWALIVKKMPKVACRACQRPLISTPFNLSLLPLDGE